MDLKKLDDININFVVGPGRSGTTLFSVMLNEYPDCISSPEIHHFIFFYKKYSLITEITEELISDVKNYISRFYARKKNSLFGTFNPFIFESLKVGEPIKYCQLIKLIYLGLYGKKGESNEIKFIIDKNPFYTLQMDKIIKIFPNAKFIALIRNYNAYTLSINQSSNPLFKKKSFFYNGLVWNMYLDVILKFQNLYPEKIKIVKYEDFVTNKDSCIEHMIDYFGISYSEKIFNYEKTMQQKIQEMDDTEKNNPRLYKRISDLTTSINNDRLNSWKKELEIKDIKKLDFICSRIGEKMNYNKTTELNTIEKCKFSIISIPDILKVYIYKKIKSPNFSLYYNYRK